MQKFVKAQSIRSNKDGGFRIKGYLHHNRNASSVLPWFSKALGFTYISNSVPRGRTKTCLPRTESIIITWLRHMTPQTALGETTKPTTGPAIMMNCNCIRYVYLKLFHIYWKAIQFKFTKQTFLFPISENDWHIRSRSAFGSYHQPYRRAPLLSEIEALWLEGEAEDGWSLADCSLPWNGTLPSCKEEDISPYSCSAMRKRGISVRNMEMLPH